MTPRRTVTLLPRPRDCGTSPAIRQENGKILPRARLKNALAAERTIAGSGRPAPRLMVTLLLRRRAMPRQSKPGPRLDVLAGTRTVTCCMIRAIQRAKRDAIVTSRA